MSEHKAFSSGYFDRLEVIAVDSVPHDVVIVGAFIVANPETVKTFLVFDAPGSLVSRIFLASSRIRDALGSAGIPIETRLYREEGDGS